MMCFDFKQNNYNKQLIIQEEKLVWFIMNVNIIWYN